MFRKKTTQMIASVLLWTFIVIVGGFFIWNYFNTAHALPIAAETMTSSTSIQVSTDRWLIFSPTNNPTETGFIFYPGGLVEPQAYAPFARAIAAQGYWVAIVPMPLNLAMFGSGQATDIITSHPAIKHWALGGHSLGGVFAADYIAKHPGQIAGLALWASHPAEGVDLSQRDLVVVSITASLDGVLDPNAVEKSKQLLPKTAQFIQIAGGNHAQFGWYGPQRGDHAAEISPESQMDQTVQATVAMLAKLSIK
jgi:hypothetical protein